MTATMLVVLAGARLALMSSLLTAWNLLLYRTPPRPTAGRFSADSGAR